MLILALVVFFVVIPLLKSIKNKSDETQKKSIDNEMLEARISKIPEMKQLYDSFKVKENDMDIVLDSSREVDFIKKIETVAEETGNKIELKIEEKPVAAKNQKQAGSGEGEKNKKDPEDIKANLPSDNYIIMQINLSGSYSNFMNFLHRLENLDYYVNVLSFQLQKETEEAPRSTGASVVVNPNAKTAEKAPPKEFLKSAINVAVYVKK